MGFAREFAERTGEQINFITSHNSNLTEKIDSTFDIVYMTRGVLCWNSDLFTLFRDIAQLLRPGGFLYIRDTHPILMTIDENDPSVRITMDYFHSDTPVRWGDNMDYSAESRKLTYPSYEWTWPVSDIINAVAKAGLTIEFFNEFNYTFYKAASFMKKYGQNHWCIPQMKNKLPLMFSLKAYK